MPHDRYLRYLTGQPLLVSRAKLDQLQALAESALFHGGRPMGLAELEPRERQGSGYELYAGGVARVPVEGVLARRLNLFEAISGGSSLQTLGATLRRAAADPEVRAILLDVDSPGGVVDGVEETAALIRAINREHKPVLAYTGGTMTSAAYWLGSAARTVLAAGSADIGSIGVYMLHVDESQADAMAGVQRSYIYAGRWKTVGNPAEPLDDEAREHLQDKVDQVYAQFIAAVAEHRGADAERVARDWADGQVFSGREALGLGLIDAIEHFDSAVARAVAASEEAMPIAQRSNDGRRQVREGAAPRIDWPETPSAEPSRDQSAREESGQALEIQERTGRFPDLDQARAEGFQAGVDHERARVTDILNSGVSAEAQAETIAQGLDPVHAFRIDHERRDRITREHRASLNERLGDPVEVLGREAIRAGGNETNSRAETFRRRVEELKTGGMSTAEAVIKAAVESPQGHLAYIANANPREERHGRTN